MKKMLFVFILCSGFMASAQKSGYLFSGNCFSPNIGPFTFTLGFKKLQSLESAITVYSPTAMVTDKYVAYDNGYFRSNTADLPVTVNGVTADSFNPNGALNMQTALGMGLVRTLLKL